MTKWQKVGEIGVDAGMCMVGDPCYISDDMHPVHNWDKFCSKLNGDATQLNTVSGRAILGVVVQSGYGDGIYLVYIKRDNDGRVAEMKVVFI